MKCPICSAELPEDSFSCQACRARKVYRRSKAGVFTGWAAVVIGSQVALAWAPLPVMLIAGFNIRSIPWQLAALVIVATIVTAALYMHSNSTRHWEWVSGNE